MYPGTGGGPPTCLDTEGANEGATAVDAGKHGENDGG